MKVYQFTAPKLIEVVNHAMDLVLREALQKEEITEETYKKLVMRRVVAERKSFFSKILNKLRRKSDKLRLCCVVDIENADRTH